MFTLYLTLQKDANTQAHEVLDALTASEVHYQIVKHRKHAVQALVCDHNCKQILCLNSFRFKNLFKAYATLCVEETNKIVFDIDCALMTRNYSQETRDELHKDRAHNSKILMRYINALDRAQAYA